MFRKLLALSLLLASTCHVFAEDGEPVIETRSELLFACGTGEAALEGMLELRADQYEDGSMTDLQFIEDEAAIRHAPWPDYSKTSAPAFFFSNSDGPDGYFWDFASRHGDDTWHLFYLAVAATEADEVDSSEAGLAVVDPTGKVTRHVRCEEAPTAYLFDLELLVGCDETNPMGRAACLIDTQPTRQKSLLETYPWMDQIIPADWQFRTP